MRLGRSPVLAAGACMAIGRWRERFWAAASFPVVSLAERLPRRSSERKGSRCGKRTESRTCCSLRRAGKEGVLDDQRPRLQPWILLDELLVGVKHGTHRTIANGVGSDLPSTTDGIIGNFGEFVGIPHRQFPRGWYLIQLPMTMLITLS